MIGFRIAAVIQRADHWSKTNRHPIDTRKRREPNCFLQLQPVLVNEQTGSRRSFSALESSRPQPAVAAGAKWEAARRVFHRNRARRIEDTVDCRRADVHDL